MSSDFKIQDNFSLYMYEKVTIWRNDNEEDNKCTTFAKKFTAALTYTILPIVGIIEGIFRGLIGLIAKAISYATSESLKERIVQFSDDMLKGALVDIVMMPCVCVGSFIHNFTKDQFTPDEAIEMFPCFKD